jgi:hypothetical protein
MRIRSIRQVDVEGAIPVPVDELWICVTEVTRLALDKMKSGNMLGIDNMLLFSHLTQLTEGSSILQGAVHSRLHISMDSERYAAVLTRIRE